MKAEMIWHEGMSFESKIRNHSVRMDLASLGGKDTGPTPKELMIASVLGCTGMDVVSLIRKKKLDLRSFSMSGEGEPRAAHPKVLAQLDLVYEMQIEFTDRARELPLALEAVTLSMTRYCGVSATVAAATPIYYTVVINGEIEARDQAKFVSA